MPQIFYSSNFVDTVYLDKFTYPILCFTPLQLDGHNYSISVEDCAFYIGIIMRNFTH